MPYNCPISEVPIIKVEITLDGVNEDNFDNLKSGLKKSVADTLGVQEEMVVLQLEIKTGTLKRSGVISLDKKKEYAIKASVEVPDGMSEDALVGSIKDPDEFVADLNKEIKQNPELAAVKATEIGEPVVEKPGMYIFWPSLYLNFMENCIPIILQISFN